MRWEWTDTGLWTQLSPNFWISLQVCTRITLELSPDFIQRDPYPLHFQGHLPSIHSEAEFEFLLYYFDFIIPLWIGGFKEYSTWSWTDQTPWDYDNWQADQPSGNGDCLILGQDGREFNDYPCTAEFSYICQITFNSTGKLQKK